LGGILSVLVFPLVFPAVWEYPLLFALAALCLPKHPLAGDAGRPSLKWQWHLCMAAGTVAAAAAVICLHVDSFPVWLRLGAVLLLASSQPGLWALCLRPAWLTAALLLVSFAPLLAWPLRGGEVIARERTWFGVYRVVEIKAEGMMPGRLRLFFHGTTLHGTAWLGQDGERENRTGYFVPEGPYGDVMRGLRARTGESLRWGVVGLGGLAALLRAAGRRGQRLRDRPGGGVPGARSLHGA